METIRINNVEIDKYEAYEYLYYILLNAFIRLEKDDNVIAENYYLDTCEFIEECIGKENIDEFIEYTSELS